MQFWPIKLERKTPEAFSLVLKKEHMEKISTNDINDEGSLSKIYKELVQINTQKQTIQLKHGQKT